MAIDKEIFDQALNYANDKNAYEFEKLLKKRKKLAFIALREFKWGSDQDADLLVNKISPWFLVAFAGCYSRNEKFNHQEKILSDLFPVDEDIPTNYRLFPFRQLLAYVYHHVYGALNIERTNLDKIRTILEQKILQCSERIEFKKLCETKYAMGWHIKLLNENGCFKSFEFLLNSYSRWPWLSFLFTTEAEYKKFLTCYQLMIYILDYFDKLAVNGEAFIPPAFLKADKGTFEVAYSELIKNGSFFKDYAEKNNLKEVAINNWEEWLKKEGEQYPKKIKEYSLLATKADAFALIRTLLS